MGDGRNQRTKRKLNDPPNIKFTKQKINSTLPPYNMGKFVKPAKPVITTQGATSSKQLTPVTTQSNTGSQDPAAIINITNKVKPIIAKISPTTLANYLKSSNMNIDKKQITVTSIGNGTVSKSVRISCQTGPVKEQIIKLLENHKVAHHSFTETADKKLIFVLKNCDLEGSEAEILQELQDEQIPALKVTTIVKSTFSRKAVHLVHFAHDSTSLSLLNTVHRRVGYLSVKWEAQHQQKKIHTICHNCQVWGHSKSHCRHPSRCVKCGDNHITNECVKPKEDNAKCANCGGDHTANFRGCPTAKSYAQMVKRHTKKPNPPAIFTSSTNAWQQPPPLNDKHEFPNITQTNPPKWSAQSRLEVARNRQDIQRQPENNISQIRASNFDSPITNVTVSTRNPKVSHPLKAKLIEALEKLFQSPKAEELISMLLKCILTLTNDHQDEEKKNDYHMITDDSDNAS